MVKGIPFSAKLIAGGVILLALVYMVVPLFMVAASSVTESQFMSFPPKGFSLQWFSEVFHSEKYLESAWTSFKLAAVVVILSIALRAVQCPCAPPRVCCDRGCTADAPACPYCPRACRCGSGSSRGNPYVHCCRERSARKNRVP